MRIPDSLASLADYGIIEEVLRPLMSGKEAQIYLVISGGEQRVAKVYKEAQDRTFKNRAEYTEGRKVRNSRDQRAMGKNSRHGRAQAEAAWRTTEVEVIYRLRDAGVRVPVPYHFIDSVLVMEMITDGEGNPAARLGDLTLEAPEARVIFDRLLAEVVRMLAAGIVHGDLSDFNVLMDANGPVVIDFPQSVDASSNQNARKLLIRDVDNLHRFMARFDPNHQALPYAQEMWAMYERGQLGPDTRLTGRHQASERKVTTTAVLDLIGDAAHDERKRREHLGLRMRGASNVPRNDRATSSGGHARPADGPPRAQARPGQGHGGHAQQTGGPTPRRVEVVVAQRPERNAPQGGERRHVEPRKHAEPRQQQAAPRPQTDPRRPARPNQPDAGQHAAPRQHARPGPGEPRQHAERAPQPTEPRQYARPSHAQAHTQAAATPPRQHAHAAPGGHAQPGQGAQGEGEQKRRRRRRRRKPGEGAPKTPG